MNKIPQEKTIILIILAIIFSFILQMIFKIPFFLWLLLGYYLYENVLPKYKNKSNVIEINENNFSEKLKNFNINNLLKYMGKKVSVIVILVVAIILVLNMIVVIEAGYAGVYHIFGKVKDNELSSGIHLINPLAKVERLSIRTEEYTMSVAQGEGKKFGSDVIDALTKEGLKVGLDITVLYHLNESQASDIFKDIGVGFEEKIIRPQIRSTIREVIAEYEAKDIYSEKRQEANQKILEKLKSKIDSRGVIVEEVLLRNVSLPAKLEASIQEKLTAEQESERYEFLLQKEEKEKQRKIIEAEGQRDAQKIINESLTSKYLEYLYITGLKDRPGTIYVPTDPNNGLPMFKGIQ